jgi:hypothetical protein
MKAERHLDTAELVLRLDLEVFQQLRALANLLSIADPDKLPFVDDPNPFVSIAKLISSLCDRAYELMQAHMQSLTQEEA